ncbi:hypothetical protein HWV07_03710 [Natronomonas salina]|uniref:hypothetical protein n=1 Tax=Natronomonas salina TaxID=1710540 RepID=UPI0015B70CD3|nr:hypothetical protein [Natronomonas salina]QLD87489.1 hypothetical protein HWV07_03710 [Natronomonas salina]
MNDRSVSTILPKAGFTLNIIGGTTISKYPKSVGMSKTESEVRGIAECSYCGNVFPAKVGPDGSARPIGVAKCTCGADTFHQIGD